MTQNDKNRRSDDADAYTNTPALKGAVLSESGKSLPDLWRIVHANASIAVRFTMNSNERRKESINKMLSEAETTLMRELQSVPAESWGRLCEASGWTQIGASFLSWCSEATEQKIWYGWEKACTSLSPDPVFLIAARLNNPKFLLSERRLSSALTDEHINYIQLCVSIAARPGSIKMDCSLEQLNSLPDAFLKFLSHPKIGLMQPEAEQRSK
ncbi:hypothetical protein [Paracoccus saliphilus]|uniref:Uncharacterized protein n=1 Tax=Paracoccus saliphilus TaxID=405559 RepID=A0AA46A4S3_9RHOB|nr:hypothetical protein [Paracoccus saliphilus]WCR02059.1 hypothetical protein JHX88_14230 [Paracoccus saliphilus]SIS67063.1 hypothetical protein SAMN05421772_102438 [Paracoccus saliphilus]